MLLAWRLREPVRLPGCVCIARLLCQLLRILQPHARLTLPPTSLFARFSRNDFSLVTQSEIHRSHGTPLALRFLPAAECFGVKEANNTFSLRLL
jgi:hypothetical protein